MSDVRMKFGFGLLAVAVTLVVAMTPAGAYASTLDEDLMADWLQLQARYPTPRDPMAVVVDVATESLYLLDDGQRIDTWPVSTGLRGTGNLLGGDLKVPLILVHGRE